MGICDILINISIELKRRVIIVMLNEDIISSKDNKWVKEYVKLTTLKSYRKQKEMFGVEGVKLVKEAFENNLKIEMVFVTSQCLEKNHQVLEKLFQNIKCYIITTDIEKKMSQTKTPQGIFAICSGLNKLLKIQDIALSGRYIMLADLQDAGNVGTIIRTAEAMGINGIIASVNTCDMLSPKVIRGSMGSIFRMPVMLVDDIFEAVNCFKNNNIKVYASVLDKSAVSIDEVEFEKPCVVLIGNEGNGLSQDIVDLCNQKITIKMQGNAESLNASMAACILMWEISKSN